MNRCSCSDPAYHLSVLFGAEEGAALNAWLRGCLADWARPQLSHPLPDQGVILLQGDETSPVERLLRFTHELPPGMRVLLRTPGVETLAENSAPLIDLLPLEGLEAGGPAWPGTAELRVLIERLLAAASTGAPLAILDGTRLARSKRYAPEMRFHLTARLLRSVLDEMDCGMLLALAPLSSVETAVSGFGNGLNEAHLLEMAALPALLLDALRRGRPEELNNWVAGQRLPSTDVAFLPGLNPSGGMCWDLAPGVLSAEALAGIARSTVEPADFSAHLATLPEDSSGQHTRRLLLAQSIILALAGIPLLSLDSLSPAALPMLKARAECAAFHPFGVQLVLDADEPVFALMRMDPDASTLALCLHNLSAEPQLVPLNLPELGLSGGEWKDLLSGQRLQLALDSTLKLAGYQAAWLIQA